MAKLEIDIDTIDGALLFSRWKIVDDHRVGVIEGRLAEDGSPYKIDLPEQLVPLLVSLQNRLSDAFKKKMSIVQIPHLNGLDDQAFSKGLEKAMGMLYYIRSYKHDQHNLRGNELAMWWCPNGSGYTYDLKLAGKYEEAKAREICGPMNMTTVGRGTRAKDIANNIMYPVAMIDTLAITTVNKYDAENRLRMALAEEAGS